MFLKTTGIGGIGGAKERELEWEQKTNQKGKNLLGYNQEGIAQKVVLIYSGKIKQKLKKKGA